MSKIDKSYHKLVNRILNDGFSYFDPNRKGVKRFQITSYQLKHDFKDGFPALTTKKLHFDSVIGELIWFLKGDTDIKYLVDNNINIWNADAYNYYLKLVDGRHKIHSKLEWLEMIKNRDITKLGFEGVGSPYAKGPLGRVYGAQWRNWQGNKNNNLSLIPSSFKEDQSTEELLEEWRKMVSELGVSLIDSADKISTSVDQILTLVKGLRANPMGTKHIVTAWNPAELDEMALPPCHWSFEILVEPNYDVTPVIDYNEPLKQMYQFTLKWHQRSVDTFLGLPFNVASYALLAHIIGKMTNMKPKGVIGDLSNVHIYEPHLKAVKEQLSRDTDKHGKSELLMLDEFHYMTDSEIVGDITVPEIINNLRMDMFKLKDYESYPSIKAKMIPYIN